MIDTKRSVVDKPTAGYLVPDNSGADNPAAEESDSRHTDTLDLDHTDKAGAQRPGILDEHKGQTGGKKLMLFLEPDSSRRKMWHTDTARERQQEAGIPRQAPRAASQHDGRRTLRHADWPFAFFEVDWRRG
jgi:hypothetical protein